MAAQTINYPPVYKVPQFAFLANPPPPSQKKRPTPTAPLPAPPGSPPPVPVLGPNTFSTIIAWAAHVQPGSPAPRSPQRRPSITSNSSRRPSISRLHRRSSITHGRAHSGSFIHIIDTPTRAHAATPSVGDFDLTALGYTSVFVHLPKTPTTPSPYLRQYHQRSGATAAADTPKRPLSPGPLSACVFASIPIPPIPSQDIGVVPTKRKGMKRFRSLSILRPRASKAKSQAAPPSPALISPTKTALTSKSVKATKPKSKESKTKVSVAERKRAKYAYVRPPPPLANELAMMQFTDGGNMETHVKRVMEAQAKAAAGSGPGIGVADVYRDGKGGLWWDQDEELEYEHLLGGSDVVMRGGRAGEDDNEMDWEAFDDTNGAEPLAPFLIHQQPAQAAHSSEDKENDTSRRSSVSTQDSDLDPTYLLPLPENEDPRNVALEDRALASRSIGGAGMSVLSLPCRPRRAAKHLCKPTFLVDIAAFGPRSPTGAGTSKRSPLSQSFGSKSSSSATITTTTKPRGKARRRPAPLKLATSNSNAVVVRRLSHTRSRTRSNSGSGVAPVAQPVPALPALSVVGAGAVERTRREFIENSFNPAPAPSTVLAVPVERSRATKPSRLGMRGFFTLARRGE